MPQKGLVDILLYQVAVSFRPILDVRSTKGRSGVFTLEDIPAGTPIVDLRGTPKDYPTRYSIQLTATLHLDEDGLIDSHINHACAANSFVDSSHSICPLIRAFDFIASGEEITINYCASEDQIAEPFRCDCGAEDCYRTIHGYSQLTQEQRLVLWRQVSPHLLRKYLDD